MNETLSSYRRRYGEGFLSIFPDGTAVPWKPLRLKEFLQYDTQFREGRISSAALEDEIFSKCVLEKNFVLNASQLEAGLATTVVQHIMMASGPESSQQIAHDLNVARSNTSNFFSDAASQIAQVFPGYTVHDALALPYSEFMECLSLAERRLMAMGIMTEPIQVTGPGVEEHSGGVEYQDLNPAPRAPVPDPYMPPPKKAPKPSGDVIIKGAQTALDQEIAMSLQGHDQMDQELWKRDALEGIEQIYPELFERMKQGEKITPETIRDTRGRTNEEVEQNFKERSQDLLAGKVEHIPSKPLIAYDRQEGAAPKKKPRVKRKRR